MSQIYVKNLDPDNYTYIKMAYLALYLMFVLNSWTQIAAVLIPKVNFNVIWLPGVK